MSRRIVELRRFFFCAHSYAFLCLAAVQTVLLNILWWIGWVKPARKKKIRIGIGFWSYWISHPFRSNLRKSVWNDRENSHKRLKKSAYSSNSPKRNFFELQNMVGKKKWKEMWKKTRKMINETFHIWRIWISISQFKLNSLEFSMKITYQLRKNRCEQQFPHESCK